jgi:acylphosphatase
MHDLSGRTRSPGASPDTCWWHGRVQGVYFRVTVQSTAEAHGVAGWVSEPSRRRVETWLEGPTDAVDAVLAWIVRQGPSRARR